MHIIYNMKSGISCIQEDGSSLTQVCKGSTRLHTIQSLTRAEFVSAAPLRLWKIWALGPRTGTLSATAHGFKPLQKSLRADYRATKKDTSLPVIGEMKNKACFSWCAFWGGNSCLPSNLKREYYHILPLKTSSVLKWNTLLFVYFYFFFWKRASLTLLSVCIQNHICWSQHQKHVLMLVVFFLPELIC